MLSLPNLQALTWLQVCNQPRSDDHNVHIMISQAINVHQPALIPWPKLGVNTCAAGRHLDRTAAALSQCAEVDDKGS